MLGLGRPTRARAGDRYHGLEPRGLSTPQSCGLRIGPQSRPALLEPSTQEVDTDRVRAMVDVLGWGEGIAFQGDEDRKDKSSD